MDCDLEVKAGINFFLAQVAFVCDAYHSNKKGLRQIYKWTFSDYFSNRRQNRLLWVYLILKCTDHTGCSTDFHAIMGLHASQSALKEKTLDSLDDPSPP